MMGWKSDLKLILVAGLMYVIFSCITEAAQPQPTRSVPPVVSPAPRAPQGAPNVLLVMTDDVGFGASSTFGGPVPTPTLDAIAAAGLRYNRFHTTAMCSPTRAALLTGRNHHTVGTGTVVDLAIGKPGYDSIIPKSTATIAQILRAHGYNTAFFGKNHNTPDWEQTPFGPFDRWPTGLGFEYFYGFFGGATSQFTPALVENTKFIEAPNDPGYLLDDDLINRSVTWIRTQHELTPDKPFFLYLATGTAHSPHHARKEWIARFKGRFDQGWDKVREETFRRQKRIGIIPSDAILTPRPSAIPSWDSRGEDEKRVFTRMMEVFAAQLSYFDHQFSRIIDELKRSGEYENTLIIFIQGDNGASGEGTPEGTLSDSPGNPMGVSIREKLAHIDEIGGPTTFPNYPTGWGWAMDTPFQWTKQIASHLGGTRTGLVISWPKKIRDQGQIRSQYIHVIDIAPTIYQAINIKPPEVFNGVHQEPIEGISFAYSLNDPSAPSRRRRQYYEMVGNQGWYEDGWLASSHPEKLPWVAGPAPAPEDYHWELYDLRSDYSQGKDLAGKYPDKLTQMRARFMAYAQSHNVFPLQNQLAPRMDDNLRPYIFNGRSHFEFEPTDSRIPNQAFPDVKNKSWSITADVIIPDRDTHGSIADQGGWAGGWGLSVRSGHPQFVYKASLFHTYTVQVSRILNPGKHTLKVIITRDSQKLGAGAHVTFQIDGNAAGTGHIDATVPLLFPDEGAGIGREFGTGLTELRAIPDKFSGTVKTVKIDLLTE